MENLELINQTEQMISGAKQEYGTLIHEVITLRQERNSLVDEIKEKRKILDGMEKEFTDLSLKILSLGDQSSQ